MRIETLCWLATAAYALHVLEEFTFDWRSWSRHVLGLPTEWSTFYLVNAIVIVLGVVAAEVATTMPAVALGFPALMLINATFFHVAPFLWTRGRFSPGLFTAVVLFYPLGIWCFVTESRAGGLDARVLGCSLLIGALLMAFPIVCLRLQAKPYFLQDR